MGSVKGRVCTVAKERYLEPFRSAWRPIVLPSQSSRREPQIPFDKTRLVLH